MSKAQGDEPTNSSLLQPRNADTYADSPKYEISRTAGTCFSSESSKIKPRHKKWFMSTQSESERLAQKMQLDLLNQVNSEILSMQSLLKTVQARKTSLQRFICQCTSETSPDIISKPRNSILANVPTSFNEQYLRALLNTDHSLFPQILKKSTNVHLSQTKVRNQILMKQNQQSQQKSNIFDIELNTLFSKLLPGREYTPEERKRILGMLIKTDFTCYGKTMCGLVLYMKYSYDFIPNNPLLLLSARWSFIPKVEKIVRYILRKRKGYQKDSEFRYSEYKSKYSRWKMRKIEPETFTESKPGTTKKIDIYGRESPLILPKNASFTDNGFILDSPLLQLQLRKESIDALSDIGIFPL